MNLNAITAAILAEWCVTRPRHGVPLGVYIAAGGPFGMWTQRTGLIRG